MNWVRHVMAQELRKIMAYRSDFWITFLGQVFIQLFIAKALWGSIFESNNTTVMNGYSLDMMTCHYLLVSLGMKITSGENIGFLSREIYDGTFNRYLIYPISFLEYKISTYLTHSLFYATQLAIIFTLYLFFSRPDFIFNISFLSVLTGIGLFLLGATCFLMIATSIELLALWADNIWSLMVMLRFFAAFLGGGFIPLTFFPESIIKFLYLSPFPYLISLPINTIMGRSSIPEIVKGIAVLSSWIIVFYVIVKIIWKKGEKNYSGVGI